MRWRGHPFFVIDGKEIDKRSRPKHIPTSEKHQTKKGNWIAAEHLRVDDVVFLRNGKSARVESIRSDHRRLKVYNLRVADFQNYAVSDLGILVHNKAMRATKIRIAGKSGKEAAKNAPSWAKGHYVPYVGENGKKFAERALKDHYPGKPIANRGPGSEFQKLKKYCDRGFKDPE